MKYREMRARAGMTAQEAATALSVSLATLLKWEKGQTAPRVPDLIAMAELYGCTVNDLLGTRG